MTTRAEPLDPADAGGEQALASHDGTSDLRPNAEPFGPTAIMPAAGAACPSCRKHNHPGAAQCVFCGAAYPPAAEPPIASVPARTGWAEGPLADSAQGPGAASAPAPARAAPVDRPISEPPPASRRFPFESDSADDMLGVPVADPLIGVVVAERYRIVEPLGRGGMGIVYKVEHIRIGKLLAMKLLTGELSRNRDVVRRFKQEALTASRLSSPNTVQVFDFGAAEGLTYLVMELVSGEDLARVLRAVGPMPFLRLGKVVIQVCNALAEAHQHGIVHRDVKPENVMLLRGRDGADVAKVLDFGLAKLREGAELNDVTSQGAIVGTPYFMAPEQIRGEHVDPRTDIYALGALMYRALTGHYPFNGPTPMAVFTKHLGERAVPPSVRTPELGIPFGVSAIVEKALAKSPSERFQRVEELQTALIDEVRASGSSSVEDLLDSGQLRRLERPSAGARAPVAPAVEIATRDEVERYERKLRRQRGVAFAFAGAFVAGAAAAGVQLYVHEREEAQRGHEIEPNNTPAEATPLPFGTTVTAHLGRRLDPTHGDRDFYAFDVPAPELTGKPSIVKLTVTALPNFGMCTLLYRQGFDVPLSQYCVGHAGRDLVINALRLEPGRYFAAVLQDLDHYGGPLVYVHENVSDTYAITIGRASPGPGEEIEPNDQFASANPVVPGAPITGTIGWARDVDVFCVDAPGAIRWKAQDARREKGTVLEVTPMAGPQEGLPVRLHTEDGKITAADVKSPWRSAPLAADGDTPRCLRVQLARDPWVDGSATVVPSGGSDAYVVEAEAVP